MNNQAGSGLRLALQRSTQSFQSLAHATQAVAFGSVGAAAVVGNFQRAEILLASQLDAALPRLRMAHHIGNGLAQGQRQNSFLCGRKRQLRQNSESTEMPAVSNVLRARTNSAASPSPR